MLLGVKHHQLLLCLPTRVSSMPYRFANHLTIPAALLRGCAVSSRLVQPRKPSGGKLGGGLGVKKLESKVDETLFEQAPAAPEPVKPLPVATAVQQEAEKPSSSSRFAYDTLTAVSAWCCSRTTGESCCMIKNGATRPSLVVQASTCLDSACRACSTAGIAHAAFLHSLLC